MTFENFIPPRSKKVLEVTGAVAEDFQTTEENFLAVQPECKYTVAKNLEGNGGKFDAIILQSALIGNLNHDELVALIKKSAEKLNRRGVLICTLDNISFAENIMAILKNQPLKFKTILSKVELEQAIADANLNQYRVMNASKQISVPKALADLSESDLSIFTYIITATPEELPPRTLLQYHIGENLVCAPIRIHLPNQFFMTEANVFVNALLSSQNLKLFPGNEFDQKIFIGQRTTFQNFNHGYGIFKTLRDAGYLFITEIDDHPVLWDKSFKASGYMDFVGAHAIQTSTKYLADYLQQFNPHVKIFANHLRRLLPPRNFVEESRQKNRPVTIFFGALNRDQEFNELLPILNQCAEHYGDKVCFKILARMEHFEALNAQNKIFLGNRNRYEGQFVPYSHYEDALKTSDIALLPLLDNQFNRAKSDLKFIECGNCGAVALASPVVYSETVKDGENGFIYNDLKDFAQKLKFLIENPDQRRALAQNAYDYVKHNRLMSQHYEERLDWYHELWARLPELTQETEKRVEKIAAQFVSSPQQNQSEGFLEPNAEIIIPD